MPALARQGHPAAVFQFDQRADAQPGARPDHHARSIRLADAMTDRQVFIVLEPGHAQRHGGEVVDQQQVIDFQVGAERLTAQLPVAVGELKQIAIDRPGDR